MVMAYDTKQPSKEADIVKLAHDHFRESMEACNESRLKALSDIKFAFDEDGQWDEAIKKKRDKLPCYTYNKVAGAVDQVLGDQRQNRPSIKVIGVEDDDKETADIYTGLIRNIQNTSDADSAYDWAFMYAAAGGFGVFRIHYDYTDPTSFDQEIKIMRVKNPFSAYYDPFANELSREDGRYWFFIDEISKEEFKATYPGIECEDWDLTDQALQSSGWVTKESVRLAEYFCKKPYKRMLVQLSDGRTMFEDELAKVKDELSAQGVTITKSREVEDQKIVWYKIAGDKVVEGPKDWAGRLFPIVPVFGKEINIGGKDDYRGLVRFAKDAQRGYNLQRSVAIEEVALRPKSPYLVTPAMIQGHEAAWKEANVKPFPYLAYNADPTSPTGKPYREQTPEVPAAALQLASMDSEDIKATTGIYDASLGARSNETSGKAIVARQREGDVATFEYIDNLAKSLKYAGRVLVDLIPKIYDTQRTVRLMNEDGTTKAATINETVKDVQTGEDVVLRDLSAGKFDVVVTVGPSYSTQRVEAAESMIAFTQANPQAAAVIGDLVAKAMDWPGSDQIAKRLKATLPPAILQAEEGEGQEQVPPAAAAKMAAMEQQLQQLMGVMQQGMQEYQQMQAENQQLKAGNAIKAGELEIKQGDLAIKAQEMALKEKEIELKERELALKAAESLAKAELEEQKAMEECKMKHAEMDGRLHVEAISAQLPIAQTLKEVAASLTAVAEQMNKKRTAQAVLPDGRIVQVTAESVQ